MEFIIDESMRELGIESVVIALVEGIDMSKDLSDEFLEKFNAMQQKVVDMDMERIKENPIILAYREIVQKVEQSVKKNPPTAQAFIKSTKKREFIPHINTVVDVYNIECLNSLLSIGGHDYDKITFPVTFTVCGKDDMFYPIGAPEKEVKATDFVYRDQKGIIAWCGVRDSEIYKIDENTKRLFFVISGNKNTSVDMRKEALVRICEDLKTMMPDVKYTIEVVG